MKRSLTITVGLLLIITMLALLAGCGGGNSAEAKEYMQEGDRLVSEIESESEDLMAEISQVFYQVADMESFMEAVDVAKSITAELSDKADEAIAQFEKIEALEGVEDYKDYAFYKIGSAFFFQEMLKTIDAFLDEMVQAVESGTVDEDTLNEIAQSFQDEITQLSSELDETERLAEELKEEKGL